MRAHAAAPASLPRLRYLYAVSPLFCRCLHRAPLRACALPPLLHASRALFNRLSSPRLPHPCPFCARYIYYYYFCRGWGGADGHSLFPALASLLDTTVRAMVIRILHGSCVPFSCLHAGLSALCGVCVPFRALARLSALFALAVKTLRAVHGSLLLYARLDACWLRAFAALLRPSPLSMNSVAAATTWRRWPLWTMQHASLPSITLASFFLRYLVHPTVSLLFFLAACRDIFPRHLDVA